MAQITINEISQNYTYNIGRNSFATVALPITAMWGPAYMDPATKISDEAVESETNVSKYDLMLEQTSWLHFPATQAGLESFVATYRGPASNYRLIGDYSYQMAMTLLTVGYDVLICRVCPGTHASVTVNPYKNSSQDTQSKLIVSAKYPGTFGNNIKLRLSKVPNRKYWNLVVYVVDATGTQTAVENLIFVFDVQNSTDNIPHIDEVESKFLTLSTNISTDTGIAFTSDASDLVCMLNNTTKGTDSISEDTASKAWTAAKAYATTRYTSTTAGSTNIGAGYTKSDCEYLTEFDTEPSDLTLTFANAQLNKEWIYSAAYVVYDMLKDKLNYNPQRIISPGWDDQDICALTKDSDAVTIKKISPLHKKIMDAAYYSRCATGMLDIPRSEKRSSVYDTSTTSPGYAQQLARIAETDNTIDVDLNAVLYTTHSALFAPWGQYKYVGMNKQCVAPPSFLALLMQRAMILNQSLQYEWALPTNRKHNLNIGKMDYKVPKKLLDIWQKLEGVGVNVITEIPELGISIWGNSTLYEVPPATYQALANLSTRYLVNAVEDVAYRCGLAITFQYNNEQAYNKFYAGVTPTLDTMKNVGAIDDYYVKMAADINGLDQVNANTVIGKIYLVINGVINDIIIDLIALPPGTDLNQYKS